VALFEPIWLLLLLPLGAAWWIWRQPTTLLQVLRAIALVLVVLALAKPALKLATDAGTIVVLADRSASMPEDAETRLLAAHKMLGKKMGDRHRLALVSFGTRSVVEQSPSRAEIADKFTGEIGPDQSQLSAALDTATSLIQDGEPARFVVLSDGRWTGADPGPAAARAGALGIPIDYQLIQRSAVNDLGIEKIDAPDTVLPAEAFMITTWVQSPRSQEVTYELRRGKTVIASGRRMLEAGRNQFMFRDQSDETGVFGYRMSVQAANPEVAAKDPVPANNRGKFLVGVDGPRPVLHASTNPDSGLFKLLKAGGVDVVHAKFDEINFDLELLSQHSAVILENVPAAHVRESGMRNLAAWVQHSGTGLMMTGGKNAYGQGGYYKSALEGIMPVTMELRQEHRKLSLAIVVVLDRSGSMMAPAGPGKTKMDLANLGTAEVFDLMSDQDEIGVIAVDSAPHTIVPIGKKSARAAARAKILRMESMGGGIYVYSGLLAGAKMLQKATAGTRHIILFADAADAEEPGKYRELLERSTKEGITCSVIGLGTDKDPDAAFLRDVAKRGNGEVYFTSDPTELPRLFAQDTFTVARSTFVEELTPFSFTPDMRSITDKMNAVVPPGVGGYNLTYARPQADLGAVTGDDYKAPVVAKWYAGSGRVLCYTGEVDGEFARPMADWDQVGHFYSSLARWTAGEVGELPASMMLTHKVRRGNLVVDLLLDPERDSDPFTGQPKVALLRGLPGGTPSASEAQLNWVEADKLSLEIPLTGKETVIANVEIPGFKRQSLAPVCLPYSEEFKPLPTDTGKRNLAALARATGGEMRLDLASVWKTLPKRPRYIEFAQWLVLAALLVFLAEILERRTGLIGGRKQQVATAGSAAEGQTKRWRPGRQAEKKTKEHKPTRKPAKAKPDPAKPTPEVIPAAASTAAPQPEKKKSGTMDALRAARKRADDRTKR